MNWKDFFFLSWFVSDQENEDLRRERERLRQENEELKERLRNNGRTDREQEEFDDWFNNGE